MRAKLPRELLLDDGVDVIGAKEQEVLAVDLDLVATELAVKHLVASLDVNGNAVTVLVALALANGDDLAALRLLLGARDQKRSSPPWVRA